MGTAQRLAGPVYFGNAAANIYNPAASQKALVRQIHLCNEDTTTHTVSLYVGATGASAGGTTLFKTFTVAANSTYDWNTYLVLWNVASLSQQDYMSGLADTANKVSITVMGDLSLIVVP